MSIARFNRIHSIVVLFLLLTRYLTEFYAFYCILCLDATETQRKAAVMRNASNVNGDVEGETKSKTEGQSRSEKLRHLHPRSQRSNLPAEL